MRLYNPSPRFDLTTPADEPAKEPTLSPASFPLRSAPEVHLNLLEHALELLGYREGVPPWATDAAKIDADAVSKATCSCCRRRSLTYHCWHRPWRTMLAISICQACANVTEV
jgi:hypothetical protein